MCIPVILSHEQHISIGCCRAIDDEDGDHVGEFDHPEGDFDEEGYPVIGTCRALYPYEGMYMYTDSLSI